MSINFTSEEVLSECHPFYGALKENAHSDGGDLRMVNCDQCHTHQRRLGPTHFRLLMNERFRNMLHTLDLNEKVSCARQHGRDEGHQGKENKKYKKTCQ
ncbi:hypothetical protein CDAR_302181 [Caerostris darwini]|uniref:Uncharacterized protein n=1 Tax=Caerostris darwini TaxID=1538125 RepID=A0AAV4SHW3_9ARAC|nr:hypothetical protein CDAR_302181 [Caerostris darwini]